MTVDEKEGKPSIPKLFVNYVLMEPFIVTHTYPPQGLVTVNVSVKQSPTVVLSVARELGAMEK